MTNETSDWRLKDRFFDRRRTLMSSLVRCGIDLDAQSYDFMDYLISQGYTARPENLDKDVQRLHTEYVNHLL
jgi:hypothetical protein